MPPPFTSLWTGNAPHVGIPPLRDQRLIGVAGALAEWCWDDRFGHHALDIDPDEILADGSSISDGDREISYIVVRHGEVSVHSRQFNPDHSTLREMTAWRNAVERAYKLFNRANGKLWADLLREARKLIVASRGIRLERAALPRKRA